MKYRSACNAKGMKGKSHGWNDMSHGWDFYYYSWDFSKYETKYINLIKKCIFFDNLKFQKFVILTILATILQSTFYKIMRWSASANRTNGIALVAAPTNWFKILVTLILAHRSYLSNGNCSSFRREKEVLGHLIILYIFIALLYIKMY